MTRIVLFCWCEVLLHFNFREPTRAVIVAAVVCLEIGFLTPSLCALRPSGTTTRGCWPC